MCSTLPYDEQELLARVAAGDQGAFSHLFRHWYPLMAGYIFRITESRELTEEIVQDVFLKIWMTRETLTGIRQFKNYLLVVCRNRAFDELKKRVKERRYIVQLPGEEGLGWYSEESSNDHPYIAIVEQAIEHLAPRRKEVFLLSRNERLTYQEISSRLGISKESVKTHIKLASSAITGFVRSHIPLLVLVVTLLQ